MSDLRTVRLRSGVETVNGITGETGPVFSEYVLLSDYQALQRDLAAERERADKNQEDAERYRRVRQIDRCAEWENLLMYRPVTRAEDIDDYIDRARADFPAADNAATATALWSRDIHEQ